MLKDNLKDTILIVDAKTLEWLKGKSRDEMLGFALNSCKAIADDVWTNIESWMQTSRAEPSIFSMPGTWDRSKCAGVIYETKPEYKNLAIAVRTGTTGFGGKIAVALCMDDSSLQVNNIKPTKQNDAEAASNQIKWYFAKNDKKHVHQIVAILPREAEVPARVGNLVSGGAVGLAFLKATWAATALFLDGDTPESEGPFVFAKATNVVEALKHEPVSVAFAFYRMRSGGVFQLFVQVDSPSVRSQIGDRYVSERAFDLDSKEDVELIERLISRNQLEICFVASGAKGPCTGFFGLRTDFPQTARDILRREFDDLVSYHRGLPERNPQSAIAQYNSENPMEDTPVLDPQLESRKFTDITEEQAVNMIVNGGIPREGIHKVTSSRSEQEKMSEGRGKNPDEATANAKSNIPQEALDIRGPEVIQQPEKGSNSIEAQSEEEARGKWRAQKSADAQLDSLRCVTAPKRRFLGIGRKAGVWQASWSRSAVVRFRYRLPIEITVTWFKQAQ